MTIGTLYICVIASLTFVVSTLADESEASTEQRAAWVNAQLFLERDHLARPNTAYYGKLTDRFQNPAKCVTALGGNQFAVAGWVEAKDSRDSTVLLHFHMKLEKLDDKRWRIVKRPVFSKRPLSDGLSRAGLIDRNPALKE